MFRTLILLLAFLPFAGCATTASDSAAINSADRPTMVLRFDDRIAAERAANALWYLCAQKQGLPLTPEEAEASKRNG